jgi:hypothetical protein
VAGFAPQANVRLGRDAALRLGRWRAHPDLADSGSYLHPAVIANAEPSTLGLRFAPESRTEDLNLGPHNAMQISAQIFTLSARRLR